MGEVGHVFLTRGDLRALWCDAWLMPCDARFRPKRHWWQDTLDEWVAPTPAEGSRVCAVPSWPADQPQPWLLDVGGGPTMPISWFAEGVTELLDRVAPWVLEQQPIVADRARHLIGMPLVGTGGGGAADKAGEVVEALLPRLYDAATRYGVDIALVTNEGPAHAAALDVRRRLDDPRSWPAELGAELRDSARRLADDVRRDNLVLFVGAGISMAAGLPSWDDLLTRLAEQVGIGGDGPAAPLASRFARLSAPDRARVIELRLAERGRTIGDAVAELIGAYRHCALGHQLLASLPVHEVVTTNYDDLLEKAKRAIDAELTILPYEPASADNAWLLKLHGCVSHPDDIVLTRADYLHYGQRRAALRGVVQAMLITRRMLFVGFSMTDDNFHRIIDDVRRAVRGELVAPSAEGGGTAATDRALATTISIDDDALFDELWAGDIDCVRLRAEVDESASSRSFRNAARLLEIYLDFVAASAVDQTSHLLDERYAALLTSAQREVRDALNRLGLDMSSSGRNTAAWHEIDALMRRLGG